MSSSNVFDAGDVVDMERRISLARVRFSFLMGFSQGDFCLVWPMQWKLSVISPISRMVSGFHVVEAIGVCEGRDLEEAMTFGGVCKMNWVMIERVDFASSFFFFWMTNYVCQIRWPMADCAVAALLATAHC